MISKHNPLNMKKFVPIFCTILLFTTVAATLPEIEPIGTVPRVCRREPFRKMKWISLAFLKALDTCFNRDSGDGFLDLYSRDPLVFGTTNVLQGLDQFASTFAACKLPPPNGVKGFQFMKILESIAGNSVYYLFTVRAPGFQDYNFTSSINICDSKIVRTVTTMDTTEVVPIDA